MIAQKFGPIIANQRLNLNHKRHLFQSRRISFKYLGSKFEPFEERLITYRWQFAIGKQTDRPLVEVANYRDHLAANSQKSLQESSLWKTSADGTSEVVPHRSLQRTEDLNFAKFMSFKAVPSVDKILRKES